MSISASDITHLTFDLYGNKKSHLVTLSGYIIYARLTSTSGALDATFYGDSLDADFIHRLTRLSTSETTPCSERNPDAPHIHCTSLYVSTSASSNTQHALLEVDYVEEGKYGEVERTGSAPLWEQSSYVPNARAVVVEGNSVGWRVTETTHTRVIND